MDKISKIFELFPLLIPNKNFTVWNGMIVFEGEEIPASISTPHFSSLKDFSVMCPIQIQDKVQQKLRNFKNLTHKGNNELLELLEHLKSMESNVGNGNTSARHTMTVEGLLVKVDYYLYNLVLGELSQLESEDILTCSGDLSEITLRMVDIRGVEHRLVLGLTSEYPAKRPDIKDVDLPEVGLGILNQAETITELFATFRTVVDSFQEFWNTYEALTKNTWVIDPEQPRLRDTHCRIIIGENVSMLLTLNPQDVNTCPEIKFLGPEKAVSSYIDSLEKKLKSDGWDEDSSVFNNLLALLDLEEFPQPDYEAEKTFVQDECSICFTVRLEDQTLPTKVCNNAKCNSYFHILCLAQWFQAVPTNETSFNLISGDCPSCGERILCPITVS